MDTTRKNTYAAPRLVEVGPVVALTLGGTQEEFEAGGLRNIATL